MPKSSINLSVQQAKKLVAQTLQRHNTHHKNATIVAESLVCAEIEGQPGHGLSRVITYAPQAANGKVNGYAIAKHQALNNNLHKINANFGFAFPALTLACKIIRQYIHKSGICLVGITHSHHFGQASQVCRKLAETGYIALIFGNAPAAMPIAPAKIPLLGTNPLAFAAPTHKQPLVIDMALSNVARGKIVLAQQQGNKIPLGWATDAEGNDTNDPAKAVSGMMLPVGGNKGALIALMIEILAAALTNSSFSTESSSLLDDQGDAPNLGQTILAIDAKRFNPSFIERMQFLCQLLGEHNVYLPGSQIAAKHQHAQQHGISISHALYNKILNL